MFPFQTEENVPLNKFSTFRIGGPARYFKKLNSIQETQQVFAFLHQYNIRFMIIGKGSNCLFDDQGFNGLVLYNNINKKISLNDSLIKVYSGASFASLGKKTSSSLLGGLEFASGIPGSVGGAVFMNAGIGSSDTASVVVSVESINSHGIINTYSQKDLLFGYRTSRFQKYPEFILSATFQLHYNPQAPINTLNIISKKTSSQPYTHPSAGCIFQNPPNNYAGKLIQEAGFKGLRIGDAEISTQHGNFIINKGRASSKDVLKIIELLKDYFIKQNIILKEEITIIPYE